MKRTRTTRASRRVRRSAGFTLVEMLVVVAIIVVLLGLAAAMGPAILGRSAEQTTKSRLQILQSMYEGYLSVTGLTNDNGSVIATMQEFLEEAQGVEGLKSSMASLGGGLVEVELYLPEYEDADVGSGEWGFKYEEVKTVLDGWNNPIFFKPADGLTGKGQAGQDDRYFFDPIGEFDRIRPKDQSRFAKIPDQGQAYFASPGPNGLWGRTDMRPLPPDSVLTDPQFEDRYNPDQRDWAIADGGSDGLPDEVDQTREEDNLYSFELDQ